MKVFDAHFHIIDDRFPLIANNGYLPPIFTVKHYLEQVKHLSIAGGAVVSGSFQGFDQTYLISALKELGPRFAGVTQLTHTTTDQEILALHRAGIRAVRFNIKRGGSEGIEHMETMAKRVYELAKWHIELYIDSSHLSELSPILLRLPSVSIDHLGLSKKGFSNLLKLAEKGIKVKATGFGRIDFDSKQALKDIASANEEALMFGTDLPSTRAPRPFEDADIALIRDTFEDRMAEKILYSNALDFYRA